MSDRKKYLNDMKRDTEQIFEGLSQSLEYSLYRALDATAKKSKGQFQDVFDTVETNIKRLTANMISDGIINPAISGISQSFTADAGSTVTPLLGAFGAGAMGAISGGQNSAIGASLGFLAGGTLGAELGGIVGSFIDGMKQNKPKTPTFDLLWETVDGQLKNVTDSWVNMGKNQEVFKAAEVFAQAQVDFFEKLAIVAGGGAPAKFSFGLSGTGAEDIKKILEQQEGLSMATSAFSAFPQLAQIYGAGFKEDFKDIFKESLYGNLGMFATGSNQKTFQEYMDWKFEQISSLPGEQAGQAFNEWMNGQAIFSPVGRPGIHASSIYDLFQVQNPGTNLNGDFSALEDFAKKVSPGWFSQGEIAFGNEGSVETWENFYTELNSQVTELFDVVTNGMSSAFTAALKTGEYQTFEDAFKASIMKSTQEALISGFAEQELIPLIFAPFYGSGGAAGFTEILKQYQEGEAGLPQTISALGGMFGELSSTLDSFQPIWETLNTGFESLMDAIGYNTSALASNTEAVMGPVNSFLQSLQAGALAPTQSIAALEEEKNRLYAAAWGSAGEFGKYSSFMSGAYLPTMGAMGDDYAGTVAATIGDVNSLPWVQAANGAGTTAADIGQQVAQAIAPMLLDMKEAAQITVNVTVDGKTLQTAIIDSLNNPAVVQAVRAKM